MAGTKLVADNVIQHDFLSKKYNLNQPKSIELQRQRSEPTPEEWNRPAPFCQELSVRATKDILNLCLTQGCVKVQMPERRAGNKTP